MIVQWQSIAVFNLAMTYSWSDRLNCALIGVYVIPLFPLPWPCCHSPMTLSPTRSARPWLSSAPRGLHRLHDGHGRRPVWQPGSICQGYTSSAVTALQLHWLSHGPDPTCIHRKKYIESILRFWRWSTLQPLKCYMSWSHNGFKVSHFRGYCCRQNRASKSD